MSTPSNVALVLEEPTANEPLWSWWRKTRVGSPYAKGTRRRLTGRTRTPEGNARRLETMTKRLALEAEAEVAQLKDILDLTQKQPPFTDLE